MAWDLWSSSFHQVSYDDDFSKILEWNCDCFGHGYDEIEEEALNVESCIQVLKILITKANTEIEELENDLLCLQNELAFTEHENWPEICCSALTERINWLDVAVTALKSGHAEDTEMQLLLHSKPAETLHEIVKALHKDHCQDTYGQHLDENILNQIVNVTDHAPDIDSNNIDSHGIIEEREDIGTSETSRLLLELHETRSDDPEKTEELHAISLVGSPDLEVVSCAPYHPDRIISSDTLNDGVTRDEDVRQSQLVTTDTGQILNTFLSKGNGNISSEAKEENTPLKENVCSDDYRHAIVKGSKLMTTVSGQILNPFLSKGNENIPSETKGENITVKEIVCSDNCGLPIITGSQHIAKKTCQISNPFSSKGNGNIPSEAKEENMNLKGNVCLDDYRHAIIKGMKMYSRSRFGTGKQDESENSDLAKKLCDFVPKPARRARRKESKVAPIEDLESTCNFVSKNAQRACGKESKVAPVEDLESITPLQIVYPQESCFTDTESSAFKENNGNNSPQVGKFEKVTLNAESSALISLPGMQNKNALCTRLQLTDEEKPQMQNVKSKIAVNFGKSNKTYPSKLKAQGKKKPEFEACSTREPLALEVIPSTSNKKSTKRRQKQKTCTAGTILNEPMNSGSTKRAAQPGQGDIDCKDIVLYDSDYVSTKRQRRLETCTVEKFLNVPVSSIIKRADDNAIVPYDSEFSDIQKKRQVSKLSITSEVKNSNVNCLVITSSDTSTETLMKKKMPELRSMARELKIKKYYRLPKATLVEELVKKLLCSC